MKNLPSKVLHEMSRFFRAADAAVYFLIIACVFGFIFSLKTPLLWGSDETTHFARSYQVSQGEVTSEKLTYPWGGYSFGGQIPKPAHDLIMKVNADIGTDKKITPYGTHRVDNENKYEDSTRQELGGDKVTYFFPNMAAYSPVAYLPSASGLFLADKLDLNLGNHIKLARVFNLIFFIGLVFVSLRLLRGLNVAWLIMAVALIPAMLFNASMISADGVANAFAILVSAIVIKAWIYKKKLSKAEIAMLAIGVICLPLVKLPYIFLSLLIFLVPRISLGTKKTSALIKAGILCVTLVGFTAWAMATPEVANSIRMIGTGERWQYINVDNQTDYVLHNPLAFAETFTRTLLLRDNNLLEGFFGQFSFVFVTVPAASILLSLMAIFMGMQLVEQKLDKSKIKIAYAAALLIVSIVGVFGTLYLTFTNVKAPIIEGVQGRYFLPFAPLLFTLAALLMPKYNKKNTDEGVRSSGLWIAGLLSVGLLLVTAKFFYVLLG